MGDKVSVEPQRPTRFFFIRRQARAWEGSRQKRANECLDLIRGDHPPTSDRRFELFIKDRFLPKKLIFVPLQLLGLELVPSDAGRRLFGELLLLARRESRPQDRF